MPQSAIPTTLSMLKTHALSIGDCVAIYDPSLNAFIEYTLCIEEIIGIDSQTNDIVRLWFSKLTNLNFAEFRKLFELSHIGSLQTLEYNIVQDNGLEHSIKHLSYSLLNEANESVILIILRDYNAVNKRASTLKVVDWHQNDSSQIRHMRKIVKSIARESNADFVMIATPENNKTSATSLVAMESGAFLAPLDYDLKGTPCELTVSGKICIHKNNLKKLYATDDFLIKMDAESYVGVPFFSEKGHVNGFLIIINKTAISNEESYNDIIDKYQPMLNRRLQLYIADQQLEGYKNGRFDHSQFLLGSTPSSENLLDHPSLSSYAFNNVKEAIIIADENSTIIQVNKAFTDITGFSLDEVKGKNPRILSSNKHDSLFYKEMYLALEQDGIWEGEIVNKTKQGQLYTEWLNIRAIYNHYQELTHYIGIFSDISTDKEHEALLYFQANYDSLTSLPNRSLLFFTLAEKIEKLSIDTHSTLFLLHLDLNGLSRINENYSYAVGDGVLLNVTRILKKLCGNSATIARISGDNFIILLNITDTKVVEFSLANTLIHAIAQPMDINGEKLKITSNIGIVSTKNAELSTDNFYSCGEQALLRAKFEGVNLSRVYDEDLKKEMKNRWLLEQELNTAIENDEFELYYQPQMNAKTNELIGVEALVRWQHPSRGLITPNYFIALAESCALMVPLGNLILQKACAQIKYWQQNYTKKFTVSVNISPKQFSVEATHHYLKRIINESAIDKSRIVLEITEDVLMTEHSDLLGMLNDFQRDGIELSLDDFGTGFSSLSYLQQYPLNELKIDRSFITTLGTKPENQTIVKAIIAMAKGLKLKVVAEGVETQQHRDILSNLGCDIFQGYYYAKPLSVDNLEPFIKR